MHLAVPVASSSDPHQDFVIFMSLSVISCTTSIAWTHSLHREKLGMCRYLLWFWSRIPCIQPREGWGKFSGENLHARKPHCLHNVLHARSTVIVISNNCWLLWMCCLLLWIGMVTPTLEHWLCKGALEQRLNCMTVGIIQWTRDYVPQTLHWNVNQESAPSAARMEGHWPLTAPATVQMGSLVWIATVSTKSSCMLQRKRVRNLYKLHLRILTGKHTEK